MLNNLIITLLLSAEVVHSQSTYSSPYIDPWYNAPSNLSSYAPGAVISDRVVTSQITGVNARQILYRTADSLGNPIATAATILKGVLPYYPNSGNQLVAYQDAEDAVNRTCQPSWLFASGQFGIDAYPWPGNYQAVLQKGWTLVIPDYEGPNSSFGAGRLAGQAVLDSMRAALAYSWAGLASNSRIGAIGYSGGGFATAWAAALQPTYAPTLNIVGFAFGGVPVNPREAIKYVDGTVAASLGFTAIAGLMQEFPTFNTRMSVGSSAVLTAFGKIAVGEMTQVCNENSSISVNGIQKSQLAALENQVLLSTVYNTQGTNMLDDTNVTAAIFDGLNLGTNAAETPTAPVYMFHGVYDQVAPYYWAVQTAKFWCSQSASVTFASETGIGFLTGHISTNFFMNFWADSWLADRMNGIPLASGCTWNSDVYGTYTFNTPTPSPPTEPAFEGIFRRGVNKG